MKISRRDFLKGSAATTAAALLGSTFLGSEALAEPTAGELSEENSIWDMEEVGEPTETMETQMCIIGGGGFSLPKYLAMHTRRMQITTLEIDPQMIDIARERFFLGRAEKFAGERFEIVCGDGLAWLATCGRRFDVIINEAFTGRRPLGALETNEGARLIKEHLTPRGIYLADVRCPLEGRGARPHAQGERQQQRYGAAHQPFTEPPVMPST